MNDTTTDPEYIREVLYTNEFRDFYDSLDETIVKKVDYVIELIRTIKIVHTKFVKKLVSSELHEMRVSVGSNEYRSILFSVDHNNIIEATQVVILSGFLKKSTKDYDKQIKKAERILKELEL